MVCPNLSLVMTTDEAGQAPSRGSGSGRSHLQPCPGLCHSQTESKLDDSVKFIPCFLHKGWVPGGVPNPLAVTAVAESLGSAVLSLRSLRFAWSLQPTAQSLLHRPAPWALPSLYSGSPPRRPSIWKRCQLRSLIKGQNVQTPDHLGSYTGEKKTRSATNVERAPDENLLGVGIPFLGQEDRAGDNRSPAERMGVTRLSGPDWGGEDTGLPSRADARILGSTSNQHP